MIRLEGVGHRFGERTVLDGVTLSLDEPRIAVIGANGSGKSTLARLLNALVLPSTGRVLVDGLDTRTDAGAVRRRVGFVFSDPDAQIVMPTVAEDVAFSLRGRGLSREAVAARVRSVLERFRLADHADHPAHLLSSGQKQLLAFASVLVSEPGILVCDEPTTLLDLRNTGELLDLVETLPQQVVMVTHDLDSVAGWARVVVLDRGRVVADGPGPESVETYRRLVRQGAC